VYKAIVLPLAEEDIRKAALWYNNKQKGLGKRFVQEVRTKVLYIVKNPEAIAVRYNNTRCAVLNVFPFMIHFTVEKDSNLVVIAAVFHTSLHPHHWRRRS